MPKAAPVPPRDDEHEDSTDMATWIAALGDLLRVRALAVRGLGAAPEPDPQAAQALAHELDEVADALAMVRAALCARCQLVEVVERIEVRHEDGAKP